nr:hypothetical protein [Micromonospora sp. DSM 115978]
MLFGVVGLLILLTVAAFWGERSRLGAEEHQRLANRERLVEQFAASAAIIQNPEQTASRAAQTPFNQADPALNTQLLAAFGTSSSYQENQFVALYATDGTVTANLYPA